MTKTRDNPQRDECDFRIVFSDIADLPAKNKAAYLKEGFTGLCTGGTAVIEVFSNPCLISKNDMVVILPVHLVSLRDISDDFSMIFFKVHKNMFLEVMSGICTITPDFFFYMRKHYRHRLNEEQVERYIRFCKLLDDRVETNYDVAFKRETTIHLLRIHYSEIYKYYKNTSENVVPIYYSHKEKIALKFLILVIEHHKKNREVAFYADKLCVSAKYLTMLMREVTGVSARGWIVEYVILEMKALLRNADLDIKDLVQQTGFLTQSGMACFFRKYTGMSPSEYRESVIDL